MVSPSMNPESSLLTNFILNGKSHLLSQDNKFVVYYTCFAFLIV